MDELPDVGEKIRKMLADRGMKEDELAEFLKRPRREISEIVAGARDIDPEIAAGLSRAFGTTPRYWLELQMAWDMLQTMRDD